MAIVVIVYHVNEPGAICRQETSNFRSIKHHLLDLCIDNYRHPIENVCDAATYVVKNLRVIENKLL